MLLAFCPLTGCLSRPFFVSSILYSHYHYFSLLEERKQRKTTKEKWTVERTKSFPDSDSGSGEKSVQENILLKEKIIHAFSLHRSEVPLFPETREWSSCDKHIFQEKRSSGGIMSGYTCCSHSWSNCQSLSEREFLPFKDNFCDNCYLLPPKNSWKSPSSVSCLSH